MEIYYRGPVVEAEIDNLGHMNVRVYARKAAIATQELAGRLGLDADRLGRDGTVLQIMETHTRFYREQLLGAELIARGGVREAGPDRLIVYMEMLNAETGDLAATFNHGVGLFGGADRAPRPFDTDVIAAAGDHAAEWPEHGRPRSLPFERVPADLTMEDMRRLESRDRFPPYTVEPEEADGYGYLDISDNKSIPLARLPIKLKAEHRGFQPGDGQRIAIATMESRQIVYRVPKVGDTVVNLTRHLDVGRKTLTFQHWSFDQASGEPISVLEQLGLGFDLDARRSVEFPPEMRARLEGNARPDLSPAR
jgi:acyl-CoA thioester hydrolase